MPADMGRGGRGRVQASAPDEIREVRYVAVIEREYGIDRFISVYSVSNWLPSYVVALPASHTECPMDNWRADR